MAKTYLSGNGPDESEPLTESQINDARRPSSMAMSDSILRDADDDKTPAIERQISHANLVSFSENVGTRNLKADPEFDAGELKRRAEEQEKKRKAEADAKNKKPSTSKRAKKKPINLRTLLKAQKQTKNSISPLSTQNRLKPSAVSLKQIGESAKTTPNLSPSVLALKTKSQAI